MIPIVDLKKQYASIKKEVDSAIQNVFAKGQFSQGSHVEAFEKNFAKYIGTKYSICVNSGTSALHLAMIILGISKGDEVIVPANTFIATAWAVSYVGATPVFVDCDKLTWQIDASKIEEKITDKTKAIVVVHLFGQPVDIDSVLVIAKKHKLFLIEDCAQAHGAEYKGKKVGTFGDIACFSFYPTKNLGAYGEGGAIVVNKQRYAQRIRLLRNQGSSKKYYHDELGYNMRMESIQAAILNVKLRYLDCWNNRRRLIANLYQNKIKNNLITKQFQPKWAKSVYHLFVLKVKKRQRFIEYIKKHDITSLIHYPIPCHLQKAYKHLGYKEGDLPVVEEYSEHCVSIPIYPELSNKDIKKVIAVLNAFK